MKSAPKTIVKNTLILYVRQIIILAIGLFTTRLTLQVLGVVDFGLFAAIAGITSFLNIMTGSLSFGIQRYMLIEVERNDMAQLNKVYASSVHLCFSFSFILLFFGFIIGKWLIFPYLTIPPERLHVAYIVFMITLVNCVFGILNISNNSLIIAYEDISIIALLNSLDAVFKLLSVIFLFYIDWDKLVLYAVLLMLSQTVLRLLYIIVCKIKYKKIRYHFFYDKGLMKDLFKFSFWIGISKLSLTGLMQGTNILLNIFFGPLMNSAYAVATQAHNGIKSFCYNFLFASNLPLIKYYASGEVERMNKLLYSVCKMAFFMVFLLSLPFVINVDYILKIWLGNVPRHASSFFILLIIYACLDVFMYPLDSAAQATGRIKKYSMIISVITFLTLPLAYISYKMGAHAEVVFIFAILLSLVSMIIRVTILSSLLKFNPMSFYLKVFIRTMIVALIALLLPLAFLQLTETNILNTIVSFVLSYITVALLIIKLGLNQEERFIAKEMIISLRNRFIVRKEENSL